MIGTLIHDCNCSRQFHSDAGLISQSNTTNSLSITLNIVGNLSELIMKDINMISNSVVAVNTPIPIAINATNLNLGFVNLVTYTQELGYTEYKNGRNKLIGAIWDNEFKGEVVLKQDNNTTLQHIKDFSGKIEYQGELELPPLENYMESQDERFDEPIIYKRDLNGVLEFCGELELPPLE